jgi:dUTPase
MYARSSLPTKTGLMVANAVAVFDSDFRGEYLMQLYNYAPTLVTIPAYTRLMQIEFFPYLREHKQFGSPEIPAVEMLVDDTLYQNFTERFPSERGAGGIGSTG